jgi:hypothetical protein
MKLTKSQLKRLIKEELDLVDSDYETDKDYRKAKYREFSETFELLGYPPNLEENGKLLWDELNKLLQTWRPEADEGIQYQKDLLNLMQTMQGEEIDNYDNRHGEEESLSRRAGPSEPMGPEAHKSYMSLYDDDADLKEHRSHIRSRSHVSLSDIMSLCNDEV